MKKYQTWAVFRKVLQKQTCDTFPDYFWDMLQETLIWSSIHEPFAEGDIEIALVQIKELKRFMSLSQANGRTHQVAQ